MSVFQVKTWWRLSITDDATQDGKRKGEEEFDYGCLAVGNANNSNPPVDKIVVGSMSGILRVFSPWCSASPDPSKQDDFSVDDVVLEEDLGSPILQVLVGLFVPMSENQGIAVLHPHCLAVYEMVSVEGSKGLIFKLSKKYEHTLGVDGKHFTAYNMISGKFGGSADRDMIMVQSLDGKLQIFEQSSLAFTRQIADILLPGPMWYMSKIDGFVTTNDSNSAECYKYQVLASSKASLGTETKSSYSSTTGMFGLQAVRGAMVEWAINLGESARQIFDGHFSGLEGLRGPVTNNELLVLCERSLFLVGESGKIKQQRRLDFEPACMCVYRPSPQQGTNFMIAGRDEILRIYSDFNLVWAAKLDFVPVHMSVGAFGGQVLKKGMIAMIGENGQLAVGFLGTAPPVQAIANSAKGNREMDCEKMDEERKRLFKLIQDSQPDRRVEPTDKLVLKVQKLSRFMDKEQINGVADQGSIYDIVFPDNLAVSKRIDDSVASHNSDTRRMVKISVRFSVSYSGEESLQNVQIAISTPSSVYALPSAFTVDVKGSRSTPVRLKFYLFCKTDQLPHSSEIGIQASYNTPNGDPRVATTTIPLPLFLYCQPLPAKKKQNYSIIFETLGKPTLRLTELFEDLLAAVTDANLVDIREFGSQAEAALGFVYYGADHIDLVKAKEIKDAGDPKQTMSAAVQMFNNSPVVSILVSKKAPRYQIQSDSLPALCLMASELEKQLNARLNIVPEGEDPSEFTLAPSCVSLKDDYMQMLDYFFTAIDVHHSIRLEINKHLSVLNDRAHQFRMVEKRLLTRFKDKNPSPLGFLGKLMDETYSDIVSAGDIVKDLQEKLAYALIDVICIAKYVVQLVSMKCQLRENERAMLLQCFCPDMTDGLDVGWEETVDACLIYLLRTSLAKTAKDSATLGNMQLEIQASTMDLKNHIGIVFDRLDKGIRLIPDVASLSSATISSSSNSSNAQSSGGGGGSSSPKK